MKSLNILTLVLLSSVAIVGQSCGSAKYGFTKKDKPKTENQEAEQPKGNVAPNEWRGTDGFWLKGTPGTAETGENITFTGSCGNKDGELTWTFGDGQTGKGTSIKHPYTKAGTYKIEGECTYTDGTTQKGQITITIRDRQINGNQNGGTQQPNQNPHQSPSQNCPQYYRCGF